MNAHPRFGAFLPVAVLFAAFSAAFFAPLPALLATTSAAPVSEPNPALSDATDTADSSPNGVLQEAGKLIARKDFDMARQLLDRLMKQPGVDKPTVARAVFLRAKMAQASDQPTDAVIWFQRYLGDYPDQVDAPRASFLLGQAYKQLGAYDRARDAFYRTLSFAVNKASTQFVEDISGSIRLSQATTWELAETEYLSSNWARAETLYARFTQQNPALDKLLATAAYRQADISFQLKRPAEAIDRYEAALEKAPFHPFATEAWLRLVTLYGMTNEKEKETTSLKSFIWMVNTLEKDDQLYWQRRCSDLLLNQYKDHLADQIPLLETIMKFQNNPGWMRMLDFYLGLLARQTDEPNASMPQPSPASGDTWNQWLGGFHTRLAGIVQKYDTQRGPDTVSVVTLPIPVVTR